MILQSLHRLYFRLRDEPAYEVPPPGYSLQKIAFVVVLSPSGVLREIVDARYASSGVARQMRVPGAGKPPGSGIHPGFLWDNTAYIFGCPSAEASAGRALEAFHAFRRRHLELQSAILSPRFAAVCRFLEAWRPEDANLYPEIAAAGPGFGVFRLEDDACYIHEDPEVDRWWQRQREQSRPAETVAQCLMTGQAASIARVQPMIKGVCGGKPQVTLVAFNDTAYESFGKEQGFNAPIAEEAALAYATALNALLDGPMRHRHRTVIADMTLVFWTERPCLLEDVFIRFVAQGSRGLLDDAGSAADAPLKEKMRTFLDLLRQEREPGPRAVTSGGASAAENSIGAWILGITPNAARAVVRLFLPTTTGELLRHLREHHRHSRVARRFVADAPEPEPEFPPLPLLLRQTARDADAVPALFIAPYLSAVFTGARYPEGMYAVVLRRLRCDGDISYARAAIIKGYLIRNYREEVSVSLDNHRNEPAYRLGRLLAALEKTHTDALGRPGVSLRNIFYGTASSSPRSVFPQLLRSYPWHLERLPELRRQERESLIEEIMEPLTGFAPHLSLVEQGLFAIGYYHQMQTFHHREPAATTEPVRKAG